MLIENPLNSSPLAFPVLECFHIVGFALSIGTIAIVDFRLLGWGMRRETPAQLAKDTSLSYLSPQDYLTAFREGGGSIAVCNLSLTDRCKVF